MLDDDGNTYAGGNGVMSWILMMKEKSGRDRRALVESLFRTPLRKAGRACGLVFHVEGPRLLRTSAVWSADDDRVIFYDSTGTRFREMNIAECGIRIAESEPDNHGSGLDSAFRTPHSAFIFSPVFAFRFPVLLIPLHLLTPAVGSDFLAPRSGRIRVRGKG